MILLALLVQEVLIPAGEFQMGADGNAERELRAKFPRHAIPNDGEDLAGETPRHAVRITKAFHLGAREVTVAEFRAFVEATSHVTDAERNGSRGFNRAKGDFEHGPYTWKNPGFPQGDDHPVVCVSWNDATAYCAWKKARLPTEAEWEYACRAGKTTFLNFGDDPTLAFKHANLADVALEKAHPGHTMRQRVVDIAKEPDDGFVYTAPAGRYAPNAFGLHDTHGNVWEWCQDRYQRFYYRQFEPRRSKGPAVDPAGPDKADENGDWRVLRGGSWATDMLVARASSRLWNEAADAFCYVGFRVARDVQDVGLEAKGFKLKKAKDGTVTELSIGEAKDVTLDDYRAIGAIKTLTRLNLSAENLPFNDEAAALVGGLDKLEHFFSNGAKLSDDGFKALAGWKSLRHIGFDHWFKTSKDKPIGAGLAHLATIPNLESIRLGGCQVGPEAIEALAKIRTLKKIDVFHTAYVTDEALPPLKALPDLRVFIAGPQFTPRLTDATLRILSEIKTLEEIRLTETWLTYEGGFKHLKALPKLKKLSFPLVVASEEDVKRLKADLPGVEVEWTSPDEAQAARLKEAFQRAKKK